MEDYRLHNPTMDFAGLLAKDELRLNLHPCLTDNFREASLPRESTYHLIKNSDMFCDDRVASW